MERVYACVRVYVYMYSCERRALKEIGLEDEEGSEGKLEGERNGRLGETQKRERGNDERREETRRVGWFHRSRRAAVKGWRRKNSRIDFIFRSPGRESENTRNSVKVSAPVSAFRISILGRIAATRRDAFDYRDRPCGRRRRRWTARRLVRARSHW